MSKLLILTLLLAGCAAAPTLKYPNEGPRNASVEYKNEPEFPFAKTVALNIFEADQNCNWTKLGTFMIDSAHPILSLPVGKIIQIDLHIGSQSILGPYSSNSTQFYRFQTKPGENYILEISEAARAQSFQVYRSDKSGKRAEVPYIGLRKC